MKKTIASHPGAINFRLAAMVILILLFIFTFLHYAEKAEKSIESQSLRQTQRIIESALMIVFASHASKGRIDDLAAFDGANPFEFLGEYLEHSINYKGEIETAASGSLQGGWYYLKASGNLMYLPFHLSEASFFRVLLDYEDLDGNGRFESVRDRFKALRLVKQPN